MQESEPSQTNAVLATAVPVAATVLLHAAVGTALIAVVKPDVPDLVPYWFVTVLGPSSTWALLVLGRAIVWRQTSAFWLGASAGVVATLSFMFSFFLVVTPAYLRGVPLALLCSSWLLLACAVAMALLLLMLGRQVDRPIDAEGDVPEPEPKQASELAPEPGDAIASPFEAEPEPALEPRPATEPASRIHAQSPRSRQI